MHVLSATERPARTRIAVVACDPSLIAQIGSLRGDLTTETFHDLFEDAAALAEFAPRALILEPSPNFSEDLGGVRMLRSLMPDLAVLAAVATGPIPRAVADACQAHSLTVVDAGHGPAELSRALDTLLTGGIPADSYLQFAQGICDEINNPLMFASGHLQVLDARLAPDHPARGQVTAIRDGLERIRRTMEKIVPLGRATPDRCLRTRRRFGELWDTLAARLLAADHALHQTMSLSQGVRELQLEDDADLVDPALFGLCEVAAELLGDAAQGATLTADADGAIPVLRLVLRDPRLAAWELPSAFEPYSINQILRGSTCGLNLFVLRLVCRAHGWDAVVHRRPDRQVAFTVRLGPPARG